MIQIDCLKIINLIILVTKKMLIDYNHKTYLYRFNDEEYMHEWNECHL